MNIINELQEHLNKKGLDNFKIHKCFEILRYIYIGQNIRDPGILQIDKHFTNFSDEINILKSLKLIEQIRWKPFKICELYRTTEKGFKVAKILIEEKIRKEHNKIVNKCVEIYNSYPEIFGFLIFDYIGENLTFPKKRDYEYLFDWKDVLLNDIRIQRIKNDLFEFLKSLGLCVETEYYVSTRGGEYRGMYYVIPPELTNVLQTSTARRGGLSEENKIICKIYYFLRNIEHILSSENMNVEDMRKEYWNQLEETNLIDEENRIKEIINEMSRKNITTEYTELLSPEEKPPFLIKNLTQYQIYLKKNIPTPLIEQLFKAPKKKSVIIRESIKITDSVGVKKYEALEKRYGVPRSELVDLFIEISKFEIELREFIKRNLKEKYGDSWLEEIRKIKIRTNFWNEIKRKLKERFGEERWFKNIEKFRITISMVEMWEQRKEDDIKNAVKPERELINYADFSDYLQIILKFWNNIFNGYFKDKEMLSSQLRILNNLGRRSVMHARSLDEEKVYTTKYAIKWLRSRMGSK